MANDPSIWFYLHSLSNTYNNSLKINYYYSVQIMVTDAIGGQCSLWKTMAGPRPLIAHDHSPILIKSHPSDQCICVTKVHTASGGGAGPSGGDVSVSEWDNSELHQLFCWKRSRWALEGTLRLRRGIKYLHCHCHRHHCLPSLNPPPSPPRCPHLVSALPTSFCPPSGLTYHCQGSLAGHWHKATFDCEPAVLYGVSALECPPEGLRKLLLV